MSKSARWTLYSIIILVALGIGYYVTFQHDPSTYTPSESWGAPEEANEQQTWTATITGPIEAIRMRSPEDAGDDQPMAITLIIESIETTGRAPLLGSTIEARATRTELEAHLGEAPEVGQQVVLETEGTKQSPAFVEVLKMQLQ